MERKWSQVEKKVGGVNTHSDQLGERDVSYREGEKRKKKKSGAHRPSNAKGKKYGA